QRRESACPDCCPASAKPANRAGNVKESHIWTLSPGVWKMVATCIVLLSAGLADHPVRMLPGAGVSNAGVGRRSTAWQAPPGSQGSIPARMVVSLKGVQEMRELDSSEQEATSGGVEALP